MNFLSSAGFKMSKKPTDPKYPSIEYTYSLLNNGKEYQIAAAMEDTTTGYNSTLPSNSLSSLSPISSLSSPFLSSLITPAYAATDTLTAYLAGNYN